MALGTKGKVIKIMTLERLTKRQRNIFNAIVKFRMYGKDPSLSQIADEIGVHKQTAYEHILALQKKYYVNNVDGKYIPTSEGVEQYIKDTNNPTRIKLINRYDYETINNKETSTIEGLVNRENL